MTPSLAEVEPLTLSIHAAKRGRNALSRETVMTCFVLKILIVGANRSDRKYRDCSGFNMEARWS